MFAVHKVRPAAPCRLQLVPAACPCAVHASQPACQLSCPPTALHAAAGREPAARSPRRWPHRLPQAAAQQHPRNSQAPLLHHSAASSSPAPQPAPQPAPPARRLGPTPPAARMPQMREDRKLVAALAAQQVATAKAAAHKGYRPGEPGGGGGGLGLLNPAGRVPPAACPAATPRGGTRLQPTHAPAPSPSPLPLAEGLYDPGNTPAEIAAALNSLEDLVEVSARSRPGASGAPIEQRRPAAARPWGPPLAASQACGPALLSGQLPGGPDSRPPAARCSCSTSSPPEALLVVSAAPPRCCGQLPQLQPAGWERPG
jgi:hypothetical protein